MVKGGGYTVTITGMDRTAPPAQARVAQPRVPGGARAPLQLGRAPHGTQDLRGGAPKAHPGAVHTAVIPRSRPRTA